MSSHASQHKTYMHPSQYAPNPARQQQQPPYPTTPAAIPTSQPHQHQSYYGTSPQQHMYSTSPQQQQLATSQQYTTSPSFPPSPAYSSSPGTHLVMPPTPIDAHTHILPRRRSCASAPIAIAQRPPIYARARNDSHDAHTFGDGHAFGDGHGGGSGSWSGAAGLDEDTLRSFEKRYAKEKKLEKRPTLGGSVLSAVGWLGGRRG